ncbi:MAG: exonuclease domain-containing protein [Bacilli bacterium]|nr:exonuclease domain-containing protein [Bacilli bacterium]
MKIYGKILKTFPKERVVKVLGNKRIFYLYMSRKLFRDFGPYFINMPYIFVNIFTTKKKYGDYYCYEIIHFNKIVESGSREKKVYYNISTIRKGVKRLVSKINNKLFLDLEFSLPSYFQTMVHIPEIVQYGMVLENEEGDLVFEDRSLVKPLKKYSLNHRTLKFLSKKREDFEDACTYIEFYQLLEKCILENDVKIIAWGRNDILTIEHSFKLNHLKPLDVRNRYINLMQVIKNYYNSKTDLGLFNTYQKMSGERQDVQQHDALEDALMTREIYRIFKDIVLKEN